MKKRSMAALYVFLALTLIAATGPPGVSGEELKPPDRAQPQTEEPAARGVLDITPWSVDGGGGAASGGTFAIVAAVGQHDTGLANACGRVLDGGVWSSSVDLQPLFCDGFESTGTGSWSSVNPLTGPTLNSQTSGGE